MPALPVDIHRLLVLKKDQLVAAILERRKVIRYARDQVGDDRCFLDYYPIWAMLDDSPAMPPFSIGEGLQECWSFYENCRADTKDEVRDGAFCDITRWDTNLGNLKHYATANELMVIQRAIMTHRDIELDHYRRRNVHDDRLLYAMTLPEYVPADFRLPPRDEFLVSQNATSGCPAFWQSHSACGNGCNLHQWGPCQVQLSAAK